MDTYLKCPNCGKEDLMKNFPIRWGDIKDRGDGITWHFRTPYCPDCFLDISFIGSFVKPKNERWTPTE